MKVNHQGKRYDSHKCVQLGHRSLYNYGNNYSGEITLLLAADGVLLRHQWTNGQDLHLSDSIEVITKGEAVELLDSLDQTAAEEAEAIRCGLIEIVGPQEEGTNPVPPLLR